MGGMRESMMQLIRLLLPALLTAAAAPTICSGVAHLAGDAIDAWLSLRCLATPSHAAADTDHRPLVRNPKARLRLPVIPGLVCRARGRAAASVADDEAARWTLERMEFDIKSAGCDQLFYCREEQIRVELHLGGGQHNGTAYAGFSSRWNTRLSDFSAEIEQLYGWNNSFIIGSRRLLYMAYMLEPVSLLRLH